VGFDGRASVGFLVLSVVCLAQAPTAPLQVAIEKYQRGDFRGAIIVLDRLIESEPRDDLGTYFRGAAKEKLGDRAGALVDYGEAIRLKPTEVQYYGTRVTLLVVSDRLAEALADADKLVELQPDKFEAIYTRGDIRARMRDYPGALADFDKTGEINPQHALSQIMAFETLRAMGKTPEALARANEVIKQFPTNASAYRRRSMVHEQRDNTMAALVAALADMDEAVRLDPEHRESYKRRANLRSLTGDRVGAQADVDKYNALARPRKK
jgi:tetratricopeptide (TPR) repeat protein